MKEATEMMWNACCEDVEGTDGVDRVDKKLWRTDAE